MALSETVAAPVGRLDERPVAREDAALESTLEKPEETELDAAGLVATTVESSELSEDARLESALEAPPVTVEGSSVVVLPRLEASESTEDSTEEMALAASEAADGTMPARAPSDSLADVVVGAELLKSAVVSAVILAAVPGSLDAVEAEKAEDSVPVAGTWAGAVSPSVEVGSGKMPRSPSLPVVVVTDPLPSPEAVVVASPSEAADDGRIPSNPSLSVVVEDALPSPEGVAAVSLAGASLVSAGIGSTVSPPLPVTVVDDALAADAVVDASVKAGMGRTPLPELLSEVDGAVSLAVSLSVVVETGAGLGLADLVCRELEGIVSLAVSLKMGVEEAGLALAELVWTELDSVV